MTGETSSPDSTCGVSSARVAVWGGRGVADVQPLHVGHRAERAGLPARLRSLFAAPGWRKRVEPRTRYGEPFLPGLAGLGRQHLGEARPLLERAEALRGRRFQYFGRTIGFPGRVDWEPRGQPKAWVIALNSLDELFAVGVAATLAPTPEVRAGWYDVAIGLARDWTTGAPQFTGVPWELPALARRIPNLISVDLFFARELRDDPSGRRALRDSIYTQAAALAAVVGEQPADHWLVAAARALFMAGRFFDGLEARSWLDTGTALLWSQLREQVHEDGGHRGRNPVAHALVLADYLEVLAFLRAANDDAPPWARKIVKSMADFLARLLHPDGELPLFHDAALGVARPARELLATAAALFHEPVLAAAGELPGVWSLLVLGEAGRRVYANLPRRRESAEPRALRRTGFYVLPGDAGDVMLLDGGTPPPGGDPNLFGYELSVGGMRLIVDAGVGGEDPGPWGDYFRSTRAHNTVAVDDVDDRRWPEVSDVRWIMRDGLLYFSGTHDGFAHRTPALKHRRRVFCLPGRFWVIADELLGAGGVEAESFIHLHPDVQLAAVCRGRPVFTAARSDAAQVQIVPAGMHEMRAVHGIEDARPQGWYAPRHGERRSAPVLSLLAIGRLPLVFGYALVPRTGVPAELTFHHDAFQLRARLRTADREYTMAVVQEEVELVGSG